MTEYQQERLDCDEVTKNFYIDIFYLFCIALLFFTEKRRFLIPIMLLFRLTTLYT